jgi:lipopolysaccharide/colanic/teichoic acid biosynthesis glycosyltransferase
MNGKNTPVELYAAHSIAVQAPKALSGTPSLAIPGTERRRIFVLGAPSDIPRALEHPAVVAGRFAVDGVLAIDTEGVDARGVAARLSDLIHEHGVDTILMAGAVGPAVMRVIADLSLINHCELLAVMPTEILADHEPVVVWNGDTPVVQLARSRHDTWKARVKRVVDICGASIGLVLTAPLLAVISVAICLDSPGSPVFQHERIGYRGCRFKCLKLRTMRADAEAVLKNDPMLYEEYRRNHFKIPDERDHRTTALGRFLRRTSLDELPQLWNVLRGEMSLIGPRPVVEDELAHYEHAVDLLLSVRPGITGAWAVSGRHGVGYPERSAIELSYVRGWGLGLDLRIALRTVRVLAHTSS